MYIFTSLEEALDDKQFISDLNDKNLDACYNKLKLNDQYRLSDELRDMGINPLEHVDNIARQCVITPNTSKIIIPGKIEVVPSYLCYGNLFLEQVILQPGVKDIDDAAFASCSNLKSIYLPNTFENIYNNAFRACKLLGKINIPANIRYIAPKAFRDCSNLNIITYSGTKAQAVFNNDKTHLLDILDNYNVPCKKIECIDGDISVDEI